MTFSFKKKEVELLILAAKRANLEELNFLEFNDLIGAVSKLETAFNKKKLK